MEKIINSELIQKLSKIERELFAEKGKISLFVILRPEDATWWDVVISANWVGERRLADLKLIRQKIHSHFSLAERREIASVVLLKSNEPFVQAFENTLEQRGNPSELAKVDIIGAYFEESYIIKPTPATKTELQQLHSILQPFDDQETKQFYRMLDSLPQNDQEEFIDLLLKTPSRKEQRQLIKELIKEQRPLKVLSSVSTKKPEIELNLSPQRSKPVLKLVVNNGKILDDSLQSQQPQQRQEGCKLTPTVNKVA